MRGQSRQNAEAGRDSVSSSRKLQVWRSANPPPQKKSNHGASQCFGIQNNSFKSSFFVACLWGAIIKTVASLHVGRKSRYFANVTTENGFLPGAGFSKASVTLFPKSSLPFALALFHASLIRARFFGRRSARHIAPIISVR